MLEFLKTNDASSDVHATVLIDSRQTSAKRREQMPYPRFTKKKKDVVPRKKRSFTVTDNILPDPNEAVKLAESISLTEAKHQEKERRLHETHAIMVIESELNLKAKEAGSGIILEVLDEAKDISGSSSSSLSGSNDENKDISSDDENKAEDGNDADLTLSSTEYGNQFLNENLDVSITDILKDATGIEIQSMSTPTPTPPTTETQVTNVSESDFSSQVVQRLSELEKKVEPLSKINHAKSSSISTDSFTEYKLKNKLFDMMQKSGSFLEHVKHLDLYNALISSIGFDDAIAKGDINPTKFNELVNAEKDPVTFDDLMGSTIDFIKLAKNRLKKDKITKANLEGPAFKLLKGTCRNSIKLKYNLEQCYLALSDQLDWANLEDMKQGNEICCITDKNKGCKEIVVRRAYQKEYTFKEADFSRLHLNDIEDMFLLYVQHKLHNLTEDEISDIVNALRTFT
ncbi:hypothetical protein Tco_1149331 [Tanacetum coccineum]